jgi:hypothetical protein
MKGLMPKLRWRGSQDSPAWQFSCPAGEPVTSPPASRIESAPGLCWDEYELFIGFVAIKNTEAVRTKRKKKCLALLWARKEG